MCIKIYILNCFLIYEDKLVKNKISIRLIISAVFISPLAISVFPDCIKGGADAILGYAIILIAVIIVFTIVKRIKCTKDAKSKLAQQQKQYAELQLSDALSWLPSKYRTSSCIFYIAEYVQNGRADSMKEVVNLLETEMHQQRMEDNAFLGAYYANKTN